ncbi:MAG: hypothetical protein VXW32_05020 [Myxococcota bacterium]|nr:hypothetical protein [Myxococcota bacterium]
MAGLIAGWALGCALQGEVAGVVRVSDGSEVHLDAMSGESYRLFLSAEAEWLRELDGASVWAQGPQLGDRFWVGEWRVVTGADGSAPYLGPLRLHGANLVLRDRNSGADYVFDEASFHKLKGSAGEVVLVSGFVVGPHTLHVVEWRVLGEGTR